MSDNSAIQWTDATWNPVTGCTRVSPGCAHCYIERTPPFRKAGRRFTRVGTVSTTGVTLHPERLEQPLHWQRPRRVFVNSLSDLWHPAVPDEFIERVFAVMAIARQHTFQVLTKRPEQMLAWHVQTPSGASREQLVYGMARQLRLHIWPGWPLPHVWLGVSVENQHWADQRIPLLLQTPATIRFLSCEPLLGPLDLMPWLAGLSWVIIGGESGPRARPMHIDWAMDIIAQCEAAGVPCFMKQVGSRPEWPADGKERLVLDPHGGDPLEWPVALRVREWPRSMTP